MERKADPNPSLESWRAALEGLGAVVRGDRIERFEVDGRAETDARMTPLLNRAWLAFSGTDAVRFLHDQLTAGISDMSESEMRLAAYCSPRGRVLALFRITHRGDAVIVELPAALADTVTNRLRLFVLRADVRIERLDDLAAIGIWGPGAGDLLADAGLPVPGEAFRVERAGALAVARLPGPIPRFQAMGPVRDVIARWEDWTETAVPSPTDDWLTLDMAEALPDIGPNTTDQFLPQSLELQRWHALSFRKGCYPGQEVIARTRYRGRLKRRLYRARIEGETPAAGTEILDRDGGRLGMVIDSVGDPDGHGALLLAVLHERSEAGECRLADTGAHLVELERAAS